MSKAPGVVVFQSDEADSEKISRLFQRNDYNLNTVQVPADILMMIQQENHRFDVAVIPLRLSGGVSGINSCLQMKSIEELAPIPIIALSTSRDVAVIEALYGSGADVVMLEPFDPMQLFFQISALSRLKRSFDEQITQNYEVSGLRLSTINAFNTVREGILITNNKLECVFANNAARLMLGFPEDEVGVSLGAVGDQFISLIQEHIQNSRGRDRKNAITYKEGMLSRQDNRSFKAAVRITELLGEGVSSAGYALSISDLSEIDHLMNMMLQSERTRTLGLMCATACHNVLQSTSLGPPTNPIQLLEQRLQSEQPRSDLDQTLTSLLELLDLVISPAMTVKVSSSTSSALAITPSDLFSLLGHIVLHAIELAGGTGETEIIFEPLEDDSSRLVILIRAQSRRVTPMVPNDHLSSVLKGEISSPRNDGSETSKLAFGLQAAQNIADRYRADVEVDQSSETLIRIRVILPLAQ